MHIFGVRRDERLFKPPASPTSGPPPFDSGFNPHINPVDPNNPYQTQPLQPPAPQTTSPNPAPSGAGLPPLVETDPKQDSKDGGIKHWLKQEQEGFIWPLLILQCGS